MASVAHLIVDPAAWLALVTLIVMEVVLGVDNLVFIALISNTLPPGQRTRTRTIGIAIALVLRLALLSTLSFIVGLTRPWLVVFGHGFAWRDLILIAGGLFLVWKSTSEIGKSASGEPESKVGEADAATSPARMSKGRLAGVVGQILLLDLVFSIDSILTAVGMTDHLPIMMAAVVVAVGLMMVAAGPLGAFIERNPSVVMLALGFLLMIGTTLIADGWGFHVPKGYIYAAMAFSALVEGLNIFARRRRESAGAERQGDAT